MHLCASVCCFAARNTKHIPVQQLHPILQLATSTGRSFWRHEMQHRWWMCPSGRKDNRISHINFVSGVSLVRAGWVVKFNLLWLIDSHSPQAVCWRGTVRLLMLLLLAGSYQQLVKLHRTKHGTSFHHSKSDVPEVTTAGLCLYSFNFSYSSERMYNFF